MNKNDGPMVYYGVPGTTVVTSIPFYEDPGTLKDRGYVKRTLLLMGSSMW